MESTFDQPWRPVRDLWGTDAQAVAGQRAMMEMAGEPARPRKTPEGG